MNTQAACPRPYGFICRIIAGMAIVLALPGIAAAQRGGGVDLRIGGMDLNVQWGNPAPVNAPYIVEPRGPVHEAFAEPVLFEPSAGFVIPRRPPDPLNEIPPSVYPTIGGVQSITWIPGYWGWDDERNDFMWVSGIWRNVPPGRQYIPGYWLELTIGHQWVSGFWLEDTAETVAYLPRPPESLERGPVGQPPGLGYVWVPGSWLWRDVGYLWRPGFWAASNPDWVWIPDHYVWAPGGFIFVSGYWDHTLARRGLLFAPVYVPTPVVAAPQFVYRPSVVVNVSMLIGDLFARPRYAHYYFGDYYERQYFRSGIYPVYAFHESDYGYDPIFASYIAAQRVPRVDVIQRFRNDYRFLRDNPNVRPPRTFAGFQQLASRRDVDPRLAGRVGLVQPLQQFTQRGGRDLPFRFEQLSDDRLDRYRRTITESREYQQERRRLEVQNVRPSRQGPLDPADLRVPAGPIRDGQTGVTRGGRDITRSRVETPIQPGERRPATVDRTTPQAAPETPGISRDRTTLEAPGTVQTPQPPRTVTPRGDTSRTDIADPGTESRSPSISREQLPEDTRRRLRPPAAPQEQDVSRERTGRTAPVEPQAAQPPGTPPDRTGVTRRRSTADRAEQVLSARPDVQDARTARSATQPAAAGVQPGRTGRESNGVEAAGPRVDRRQGDLRQLRLRRSPLGGRGAEAPGQDQGQAGQPNTQSTQPAARERVTAPPPVPRGGESERNAQAQRNRPDRGPREPRAPQED